jgi:hypothetical protein
MFSARVENERLLAEMQMRLQARIELAKREGRTMDRGVFIEEMREELRKEGYKRGDAKRGSLQDLKSTKRLGLIWDMNVSQAQGYARWKADMTPEGLENEPCYELIRVMDRMERRDWPTIWSQAGGEFFGGVGSNDDYPFSQGRMIAAKNDPIWIAISRFGTPWPPFDWGSGMGLRGIDRDETESLGVLDADDEVLPMAVPFNSGHRMSVAGLPETGLENLRSAFGDTIRFDGDDIIFQRELTPETYEQRKQSITESLRERARTIEAAGRVVLTNARSENGPLAGSPGPWENAFDEILASTSAVATGRKQLYHEGWAEDAAVVADLLRAFLPQNVRVLERDGHVHAWRPDLLRIAADEVHAAALEDRNGRLLGYGQNLFDVPSVPVNILGSDGNIIGGFFAHPDTAVAFARARAKDFTNALGSIVRIIIDGKEVRS